MPDNPATEIDVAAFRQRAAECIQLAQDAESDQHRALLLAMAQKWVELADQARTIHALLNGDLAQEHLRPR